MLPSLDKYLHAKNLRYQLIFSRDINDQRILQSDWLRTFLAITEDLIFPRYVTFAESYGTLFCTIFRIKKTHHWIKVLAKTRQLSFEEMFGFFSPK